jgi:hypothetical protein
MNGFLFFFIDILILLISCSGLTMLLFQFDFLFPKNFQERKNEFAKLNSIILKLLTGIYLLIDLSRIGYALYEVFQDDSAGPVILRPARDLSEFWAGFLLAAIIPLALWIPKISKKKIILLAVSFAATFYFWMPLLIQFTTSSTLEALDFQFSNGMLYADVGILYCLWIPLYWFLLLIIEFIS